tara:strand:+ start:212 stop:568 length:357 start_codon:yes stop_codon:yes gene_type:complete
MVAFNFKTQYVSAIESGIKCSTIRQRQRAKVGGKLQLYVGQRTNACRKIKDATCIGTAKITMNAEQLYVLTEVEGICIPDPENKPFFMQEGFESVEAMRNFFKEQYGLPFVGYLVTWD